MPGIDCEWPFAATKLLPRLRRAPFIETDNPRERRCPILVAPPDRRLERHSSNRCCLSRAGPSEQHASGIDLADLENLLQGFRSGALRLARARTRGDQAIKSELQTGLEIGAPCFGTDHRPEREVLRYAHPLAEIFDQRVKIFPLASRIHLRWRVRTYREYRDVGLGSAEDSFLEPWFLEERGDWLNAERLATEVHGVTFDDSHEIAVAEHGGARIALPQIGFDGRSGRDVDVQQPGPNGAGRQDCADDLVSIGVFLTLSRGRESHRHAAEIVGITVDATEGRQCCLSEWRLSG